MQKLMMLKTQKRRVLSLSNKLLMLFTCLFIIYSCNQKKIEQDIVISQLRVSYSINKNSFDSLKVALGDTSLSEKAIQQIAKKIMLKNNFGFGKLLLSATVSSKNEKAFNVKELDYGVSCGYLYIRNPIQDSFANSRLVYKKIDGNWYSYLFFN